MISKRSGWIMDEAAAPLQSIYKPYAEALVGFFFFFFCAAGLVGSKSPDFKRLCNDSQRCDMYRK